MLFMHLLRKRDAQLQRISEQTPWRVLPTTGWRINQSPIAGGSVSMYAPGEANQHTYSYGAQLRARAFK